MSTVSLTVIWHYFNRSCANVGVHSPQGDLQKILRFRGVVHRFLLIKHAKKCEPILGPKNRPVGTCSEEPLNKANLPGHIREFWLTLAISLPPPRNDLLLIGCQSFSMFFLRQNGWHVTPIKPTIQQLTYSPMHQDIRSGASSFLVVYTASHTCISMILDVFVHNYMVIHYRYIFRCCRTSKSLIPIFAATSCCINHGLPRISGRGSWFCLSSLVAVAIRQRRWSENRGTGPIWKCGPMGGATCCNMIQPPWLRSSKDEHITPPNQQTWGYKMI